MSQRDIYFRRVYLSTILFKGFNGLLEFLAGAIFYLAGSERLYNFVVALTAPELADNPDAMMANLFRQWFFDLMHVSKAFVTLYLLLHGAIKFAIAYNLLVGKHWAYPVASVVLAGFIVYMGLELTHGWSWVLFALMAFDIFTLGLVLQEWRNVAAAQRSAALAETPAE